jgi:hypothetical protein
VLSPSLFCVTIDKVSVSEDSGEETPIHSYNSVKSMIEELGGKICNTVHKKVDFIISSDIAVKNATQKIRKAYKFDIPVLKIDYIEYCYKNKSVPKEISRYVYPDITDIVEEHRRNAESIADSQPDNERRAKKRKRKARDISDNDIATTTTYKPPRLCAENITFECSCICHDQGKKSCDWCIGSHTM